MYRYLCPQELRRKSIHFTSLDKNILYNLPVTNCFLCLAGIRQAGKRNANRRQILSLICKLSVLVLHNDVVECAEILESLEWRVYKTRNMELFTRELPWQSHEERRETGRLPG
jgi:hypothetical protein